jgi:hypothetical protein
MCPEGGITTTILTYLVTCRIGAFLELCSIVTTKQNQEESVKLVNTIGTKGTLA